MNDTSLRKSPKLRERSRMAIQKTVSPFPTEEMREMRRSAPPRSARRTANETPRETKERKSTPAMNPAATIPNKIFLMKEAAAYSGRRH
jgi:hypothetical protein